MGPQGQIYFTVRPKSPLLHKSCSKDMPFRAYAISGGRHHISVALSFVFQALFRWMKSPYSEKKKMIKLHIKGRKRVNPQNADSRDQQKLSHD